MWREIWTNVLNTRSGRKILNKLIRLNKHEVSIFHQHLIALPTARNTAKLPPLCSITLPSCVKSSRPLRPYLIPAALPNIAPVDIPIAKPIIAPYFTLSKQVGPRGRAPDIGMVTNYSSSLALLLNLETRNLLKNLCPSTIVGGRDQQVLTFELTCRQLTVWADVDDAGFYGK